MSELVVFIVSLLALIDLATKPAQKPPTPEPQRAPITVETNEIVEW